MPRLPHSSAPLGSLIAIRTGLRPPNFVAYVRRRPSSSEVPTPAKPPNPHREVYKKYALPWSKVFLGAFFTYQVLYWAWLKLESLDVKQEKNEKIKGLEGRIRELTASKPTKG